MNFQTKNFLIVLKSKSFYLQNLIVFITSFLELHSTNGRGTDSLPPPS